MTDSVVYFYKWRWEIPVQRKRNGILAQLGEHLPYKQRVTGSSPVGPTSINRYNIDCLHTKKSWIGFFGTYGEVAQLARASGSYPGGYEFKSHPRYLKVLDISTFFVMLLQLDYA